MANNNNGESVRQRGTIVLQNCLDDYMNSVVLPQLENGLRQLGISVEISQLSNMLELPAISAPVNRTTAPSAPHFAPPTLPPQQQIQSAPQQHFGFPPANGSVNYDGDNYTETGCLYFSRRGGSKFIFCGAPTMEGSPVCKGCSTKGDGKKLMMMWQQGQPIDRNTIRNEAATRRTSLGVTPSASAKAPPRSTAGKSTVPAAVGNGFTFTKPPPPNFLPAQATNPTIQSYIIYDLGCPWRQGKESLFFIPKDKVIVTYNSGAYLVVGHADDSNCAIRKLTTAEYQYLTQQGMKCDSGSVQADDGSTDAPQNSQPTFSFPVQSNPAPGKFAAPLLPIQGGAGPNFGQPAQQNNKPFQVQQTGAHSTQFGIQNTGPQLPNLPQNIFNFNKPVATQQGSYPQPPSFNGSFTIGAYNLPLPKAEPTQEPQSAPPAVEDQNNTTKQNEIQPNNTAQHGGAFQAATEDEQQLPSPSDDFDSLM